MRSPSQQNSSILSVAILEDSALPSDLSLPCTVSDSSTVFRNDSLPNLSSRIMILTALPSPTAHRNATRLPSGDSNTPSMQAPSLSSICLGRVCGHGHCTKSKFSVLFFTALLASNMLLSVVRSKKVATCVMQSASSLGHAGFFLVGLLITAFSVFVTSVVLDFLLFTAFCLAEATVEPVEVDTAASVAVEVLLLALVFGIALLCC